MGQLLREKCPYPELFWSVSSLIRAEYGEILYIPSYSVRMRENTDQNNSEHGHFLPNYYAEQLLEVYSDSCQISKMKRFAKIINSFKPLTIFTKHSILDIWQGSEYASDSY